MGALGGIGAAAFAADARGDKARLRRRWRPRCSLVALVPLALNWRDGLPPRTAPMPASPPTSRTTC